jgi:carbon monoxide dehydrogenase subunit G
VQQQGEYTINGSVDSIWQALNDPDALKASIPGCQSIEQEDAENLKATVRAKVGPVNAAFQVTLVLTDVKAPYSYTLNGEVRGGAGVAKGHRPSAA